MIEIQLRPLSPDEIIPGAYDEDDVWGIPPQQHTQGHHIILKDTRSSLAELDADRDALERWIDLLINDHLSFRTIYIIKTLGITLNSEDLRSNQVVDTVKQGESIVVELGEEQVTVLDLFQGDKKSCRYALWHGLYHWVKQSSDVPPAWMLVFENAQKKLELQDDRSYQDTLQMMDNPKMIQWLNQENPPESLYMEIQTLLFDDKTRNRLRHFLAIATHALFNTDTFNALNEMNLFPAGNILVDESKSIALAPSYHDYILRRLSAEPITGLYFILHLLSDKSQTSLLDHLRKRFLN